MVLSLFLGIIVITLGVMSGWLYDQYVSFILMVTGYYLVFEGLNSFWRRKGPSEKLVMFSLGVLFGALLGVLLDFDMISAGIMKYRTMDNWFNLFLLYLGWGISFPAMYESYMFISHFAPTVKTKIFPKRVIMLYNQLSLFVGLILNAVVVVIFLHRGIPGYFAIFMFLGNFLILDYIATKITGLRNLGSILMSGDLKALSPMIISAALFCIAWEGMNVPMGHWQYQNIFWLTPTFIGIPMVAFFGYFCWFVIYLSVASLLDKDVFKA
jgi:hypothetical protein